MNKVSIIVMKLNTNLKSLNRGLFLVKSVSDFFHKLTLDLLFKLLNETILFCTLVPVLEDLSHELHVTSCIRSRRNCAKFGWVSILKIPLRHHLVFLSSIKRLQIVNYTYLVAILAIFAVMAQWLFGPIT